MQNAETNPAQFKDQIETPALLIDLDRMESNIRRMADFFRGTAAKLRPHVKTHKTPILAHKQLAAGSAVGITAAKLGEAEVMVRAGIQDILIANEIIPPSKIARLAGLSRHANMTVAVDDPTNIRALNEAAAAFKTRIGVLVEVNVGLNRCGVGPGEPALQLAREVLASPGLIFRGLMGYEGHVVLLPDPEKRKQMGQAAMEKLVGTRRLLERNGIPVEIVSAGGTGTHDIAGVFPGVDEVQAGSYILMDTCYRQTGVKFEQALTLYVTVISRPNEETAIVDAGMKAITIDHGMPAVGGHSDWALTDIHEEHGIVHIPGGDRGLRPGDRLELVPSHVCTTVNLHDRYYALRDNRIEAVWTIAGRGQFR